MGAVNTHFFSTSLLESQSCNYSADRCSKHAASLRTVLKPLMVVSNCIFPGLGPAPPVFYPPVPGLMSNQVSGDQQHEAGDLPVPPKLIWTTEAFGP